MCFSTPFICSTEAPDILFLYCENTRQQTVVVRAKVNTTAPLSLFSLVM